MMVALLAAPTFAENGGGPFGSVGASYDCEGLVDFASSSGEASAGTGIHYDFGDGVGGNSAGVGVGYTSVYTTTITLDSQAFIALPGSAASTDCRVSASASLTQPLTFTGGGPSTLTQTVEVSVAAILDGWQGEVPVGAPPGSDAQLFFNLGLNGTLFSESFRLVPGGIEIANQPRAWTVDPLPGGGVSVSGGLVVTQTLSTSSPAYLELIADHSAFVPAGAQGFTVTNTLPGALRYEVRSLTPGVEVVSQGIAPVVLEPQTRPQRSCLGKLNKASAKVAQAQLKLNERCIRDTLRGKESSAQLCVGVDSQQKVLKRFQKSVKADEKKCQKKPEQLPGFSYVPASSSAPVARSEGLAYLGDLLGPNADLALPTTPEGERCQRAVLGAGGKYLMMLLKEAVKAKKKELRDGAASPSELETAMTGALGSSQKLLKLEGKLQDAGEKSCEGVADLGKLFPGTVAIGVTPRSVTDEAARTARCRACILLNTFDALSIDCDAFDDGVGNASCL